MENSGPATDNLVDGKYSIKDLVDMESLRQIFESFYRATGATIGFVSYPEQEILLSIGWRDICTKFHRINPGSLEACHKSNLSMTGKLKKTGELNIEDCDNGMADGGTPIIIKGKHIATLATGQVFFKKPDLERFREQARKYGYDEDAYLKAVKEVPVVSKKEFSASLEFLGKIASLITELGYDNLAVKENNQALKNEVVYREMAEARIIHLNSVLQAVSSISQLIIKEKDRDVLLREACRILVETRHYRMAWIGLIEEGSFDVKPVAHAGHENGYLQNNRFTYDDSPSGQGPTGVTIKTMKPSVVNEIKTDPVFEHFRHEALARGYRSMVSVPVARESDVYGVLNVYSDRPDAFDEHEVSLLAELAADMAFAIFAAQAESERQESEKALVESEESYRSIFDAANDAIFICDIESNLIIDVNQKACEMFLYDKDELVNRNIGYVSMGESPYGQDEANVIHGKAAKGEPQLFEWVCKDMADRLFWVEVNLRRAVINGKYRLLSVVRDITERKNNEERWEKIHDTFFNFGADPAENINKLTALCGEIMGADCALYNKLNGDDLYACGRWHVPDDFRPVSEGRGHICYDVIKKRSEDIVVIRDLQKTGYVDTDPNVLAHDLQTYIGKGVKVGGEFIGTLCTVYQRDYDPSDEDKEIMSFIAHAISVEEERNKAEHDQRLSHQRFHSYFDLPLIGIAITSVTKGWVEVNDRICEIMGYSREELITKTWAEMTHPEDLAADVEQFNRVLSGEIENYVMQKRFIRKDGDYIWTDLAVGCVRKADRSVDYIVALVQDITDRKNQEEELLRRDYQLEIVSRTSQHINAILEVPTILRTLIAAAIELVDASAGTAGVVSGETIDFREYHKDGKIIHIDYSFRPGEGICGCITRSLKTHISNDAENDPNVPQEFKEKFGLRTMVDIPILNRDGKLLGCLELHNKLGGRRFDAQDVFMLQGMAAGAAIALENAHTLSERNKIQEALAWQKEYYEGLFSEANVWIEVVDRDGNTVLWNKKAEQASGYKRDDLIGNTSKWDLEYPDAKVRNRLVSYIKKLIASGKTIKDLETEIVVSDGTKRTMTWSSTIIRDSYGKIIGSMFIGNDVSDRKAMESERETLNKELTNTNKRLSQLALKDSETGLHNHHYLTEVIEPELYRAKRYVHPLSLIMIDIDYFRSVNDLYGHDFGDMVLRQFAVQLKKMVRRYDVVVRFSGEEFMILSSGADKSKAIALAHRLMEALSIYNFGDNKRAVKLRMSISVASYPDDPIETGMELIYIAEKLLDKVKEAGGNKVFCSSDVTGKKLIAAEPTDIQYLKKKITKLTKHGRQSLMESIFAFAKTIEMRDHYTGEHADSTVHYATQLARALKLGQEDIDKVRQAAILHDLGKVGISDKILLKRAKLTKKEYEEIKKHPQIAADIIRPIQFMKDIIPLILYHHEKWNGTGYPTGIKGAAIPIGARIISIADVYQALTSDRPYRKAYTKKEAMKILRDNIGIQFDPEIVKVFLDILKNEKDRRSPAVVIASGKGK